MVEDLQRRQRHLQQPNISAFTQMQSKINNSSALKGVTTSFHRESGSLLFTRPVSTEHLRIPRIQIEYTREARLVISSNRKAANISSGNVIKATNTVLKNLRLYLHHSASVCHGISEFYHESNFNNDKSIQLDRDAELLHASDCQLICKKTKRKPGRRRGLHYRNLCAHCTLVYNRLKERQRRANRSSNAKSSKQRTDREKL